MDAFLCVPARVFVVALETRARMRVCVCGQETSGDICNNNLFPHILLGSVIHL